MTWQHLVRVKNKGFWIIWGQVPSLALSVCTQLTMTNFSCDCKHTNSHVQPSKAQSTHYKQHSHCELWQQGVTQVPLLHIWIPPILRSAMSSGMTWNIHFLPLDSRSPKTIPSQASVSFSTVHRRPDSILFSLASVSFLNQWGGKVAHCRLPGVNSAASLHNFIFLRVLTVHCFIAAQIGSHPIFYHSHWLTLTRETRLI